MQSVIHHNVGADLEQPYENDPKRYRGSLCCCRQCCQGQLQSTLKSFQQALAKAQADGDRVGQMNALKRIGLIHCKLQECAWGIKCLEQALQIAEAIEDWANVCVILNYMGAAYCQTGQQYKALKVYIRALALFQNTSNQAGIAKIFNHLGEIYNCLGHSEHAISCCRQAMKIFQDLGNSADGEGVALHNIGEAYLQLGRPRQALALFEQALAIRQKLRNSLPLGNVSQEDASTELRSHSSSGVASVTRTSEATTLESMGMAYVKLNQHLQALKFYQQAWEIRRKVGMSPSTEAKSLNYIGAVYYKLGNCPRALWYHLQALGVLYAVQSTVGSEGFFHDPASRERLLHQLVAVYDRLDLHDQGIKCYQAILEIIKTFGDNASEEAICNYLLNHPS
jgi:tetratricopeptide (TPR) repeat protein